jgi:hypothetical protein
MMTQIEFQKKYHEYATKSKQEAFAEAEKVNTECVECKIVIPVQLDNMWCLMLLIPADEIRRYKKGYNDVEN